MLQYYFEMRKILSGLLIFIFLSGALAWAEEVTTGESRARNFDLLFKKALAREKISAYDDALFAYNVILSESQKRLNSKTTPGEVIEVILPYAIAAAYRKGIVTHRSIEGSVVKLYKQLKLYEDSDKWINEILTQISNLKFERGLEVSDKQLGLLYYARAYNKLGWSYALFNGSLWKRYVIYTPPDVLSMVDKAIEDLGQVSSIYEASYTAEGNLLDFTLTSTAEVSTLSLCFNIQSSENLKPVMGRQLNAIFRTVALYRSPEITSAFETGKKIYTFEDLMKPEAKEVISAMAALLKEITPK